MKIYDKAKWQIDGGVNKEVVIKHFEFIFCWLKERGLLSKIGEEIYNLGIDEEISLNEEMVTREGATFLAAHYDELINKSQYNIAVEKELLSKYD